MRILFVDNHREFTSVVVSQFLCEHTVEVVPTLASARAAVATSDFDVVLVDYDLDDGKGDALLRWFAANGSTLPAIAVSSHEFGNAALMAAGARVTCSKLDFAKINSVIGDVFRSSAS